MMGFFQALSTRCFLQHARRSASIAQYWHLCGCQEDFANQRDAHTILGGMGIAYYLGFDPAQEQYRPLAAAIIGLVSLKARQHGYSHRGTWAVGMALGSSL